MLTIFKSYFQKKSLKDFYEIVKRINALESEVQAISDEQIKAESSKLKEQLKNTADMTAVLPRAFALAREVARRTLKQRPYDVQLIGGLALHKGAVAEMATGEGKTLAAVAPVYLNALGREGVHVVTVNEYLARRDAVWMGQIYHALGLSVSCLIPNGAFLYDPEWHIKEEGSEMIDKERDERGSYLVQQEYLRPISRREAYLADITYGNNHEFGFDYLRDNLAYQIEGRVQRGHHFAIIDEVDSILIDEARTPLIISAPDEKSSEYYKTFARIVSRLKQEEDYTMDEKLKTVAVTEGGIEKIEKVIGVTNLYAPENLRLVHYLEESLRAKALYKLDRDYVVKQGEIIIVDEFTGRLLQGRRYNGGLHQAIEAKEGVFVKEESRTYAKISIQNYFRLYKKISGMTGTAQTSAEEFHKVYGLEVFSIPTNKPSVRKDTSDVIYKNFDAKLDAIAKDIRERYEKGQPVLVGTTSIAKNEMISARLSRAGVPHEVLNAKNNEREGSIIAQAGRFKAVTVATNMAGRGVDIILGGNPPSLEETQKIRDLGGLYVVGTERHEARRIDNQLRGRSGRQGDPGLSQFFLSLDDDLLRIFGGDRIKGFVDRFNLPGDQPIQVGFVSKAVSEAQAKVEGANFDMRKHLLEFDDVLNKQRTAVYKKRQEILESMNREALANIIFDAVSAHIERFEHDQTSSEEEIQDSYAKKVGQLLREARVLHEGDVLSPDAFLSDNKEVVKLLTKRSLEATLDPQTLLRTISVLDMLWMNHLDDLEALQEAVGLRAYGQKDPLVEYRREASILFKSFWVNFNEWMFMNIFKLAQLPQQVNTPSHQESTVAVTSPQQDKSTQALPPKYADKENATNGSKEIMPPPSPFSKIAPVSYTSPNALHTAGGKKVGRNEPCPCGAKNEDGTPKKYKKCHGK